MNARGAKEVIGNLLTSGTKEVTVALGTPMPLTDGADRKRLTKAAEIEVRRMLVALNRGQPLPELAGAGASTPIGIGTVVA